MKWRIFIVCLLLAPFVTFLYGAFAWSVASPGGLRWMATHWQPLLGSLGFGFVGVVFLIRQRNARRLRYAIRRHPDAVYDFFLTHADEWLVFPCAASAVNPAQLPDGKLLGPLEFRVPKLGDRVVAAFGRSADCFDSLEQMLFQIQVKVHGRKRAGWQSEGRTDALL